MIAFTPGEPAGIGLDLAILNANKTITDNLLTITDPDILLKRAKILKQPLRILENKPATKLGDINIYPLTCPKPVIAGKLNPDNAPFVLSTLDTAISHCLTHKTQALLTGPIHKGVINQAGIKFTGHTEYLAKKTNKKVVMMLANEILKVALVTTHLPLDKVSQAITKKHLTQVIQTLHNDLKNKFNLKKPRIAVCGLNPHAGENGYLGNEEINIITPVIHQLRNQGVNLSDALPADTLFTHNNLKEYDVILSMYHDQGLPVLKALGFENSVNITLGLPFIRTSVDHGTALNLAGSGHISLTSLETALKMTKKMLK